ncbi:MAG: DNA-processing protein DprA [Syntrophales bacterium]|nr:DNA-processing protein DprA [Syntrophales bacterium]
MESDIKYWIALKLIDGVGNVGFKNLIEVFGSPENALNAPTDALKAISGITRKTALNIKGFNDWQKVDKELELADKTKVSIITADNSLYPKSLLNIYDFPPFLYVKGTLREDDINVAVIGSRMATTYGKFSTQRLCQELALRGITIVSGMARGIDSAAHTGALTGKGRTIAVLGCGIDIVYPLENKKLLEKICENGAVITEFPFSTPPSGANFPARNRIISGMSLGVVVIEAGDKSGSLITARLALEQGREVFAVPGSIDSPGSRGTHKLIREGAKLIESVHDILEEITPQIEGSKLKDKVKGNRESPGIIKPKNMKNLNDTQRTVLKSISGKPVNVDTIIAGTGFKAGDILNVLLALELEGYIEQMPGKIFKLKG